MDTEVVEYDQYERRRFWRRSILRLVFVVLLIFASHALWSFVSGRAALQDAIDETEAIAPRWQIEDLLADRAEVPDKENAALVIMRGHNLIDLAKEPPPVQFDVLSEGVNRHNHRFNEVHKLALDAEIAPFEKALPEYRLISTMPRGRFPYEWKPGVFSSQDGAPYVRKAYWALWYDFLQVMENGEFAIGVDRVNGIFNAGRAVGDEPTIMAILNRIAARSSGCNAIMRLLALSEPNAVVVEQLQQMLEGEIKEPLLENVARAERALGFAMLDSTTVDDLGGKDKNAALGHAIGTKIGLFAHLKANHLNSMNRYLQIVRKPIHEQHDELMQWDQHNRNLKFLALMHLGLKPIWAIHRSYATMNCAITALAAERFRLKHQRWPDTLDEMVAAGFLKSIPLDPFDGKPLRWKTTENGRLIYSIGQDRTDNGGAFDSEKPTDPGNDIIFRLYDPAHRRLPPVPPKPKAEEPKDQ